jgi:hypothetical protein
MLRRRAIECAAATALASLGPACGGLEVRGVEMDAGIDRVGPWVDAAFVDAAAEDSPHAAPEAAAEDAPACPPAPPGPPPPPGPADGGSAMCLSCIEAHCASELAACAGDCWCVAALRAIVQCAASYTPPGLNQVNCAKLGPPGHAAVTEALVGCIDATNPRGGEGCSVVCGR